MKNCVKCGGFKHTPEETEQREAFIAADQSFDAGEFSGSFDYYKGDCTCMDEDLDDEDLERVFDDDYPEYNDDWGAEYNDFADPGGNSALRAATKDNPRNQPCPTCGDENVLTPKDIALHYQCDRCSDQDERGW